jgi:hypothetical protein
MFPSRFDFFKQTMHRFGPPFNMLISNGASTDDGNVWCFGDNSVGQLASGTLDPVDGNTIIDATMEFGELKPSDILAGWDHIMIVYPTGQINGWGGNQQRQLLRSAASGEIPYLPPYFDGFVGTQAEGRRRRLYTAGRQTGFAVSEMLLVQAGNMSIPVSSMSIPIRVIGLPASEKDVAASLYIENDIGSVLLCTIKEFSQSAFKCQLDVKVGAIVGVGIPVGVIVTNLKSEEKVVGQLGVITEGSCELHF